MSPTLRCFLAFDLPEEIRAVVKRVHGDLNKSPLDVRWVRPGNVHLTVVFLGNVAVDDLQPLGEQVKAVCTKYGPFEIGLNGVGVFGGMKSPRVLWLGVEGDVERMGFFQKIDISHVDSPIEAIKRWKLLAVSIEYFGA